MGLKFSCLEFKKYEITKLYVEHKNEKRKVALKNLPYKIIVK